jgi:predicted dehydrogenase/GNAT superfamily N-acetyltransferase
MPQSLFIDASADPDEVASIFLATFGEAPEQSRLTSSQLFLARAANGEAVAAAAMERLDAASWCIWLFAVKEEQRGRGYGRGFLAGLASKARDEGGVSLELKTYRRWHRMRTLLRRSGWFLLGAEMSKRNDGVGELWQLPLLDKPLGIVVVGANPAGRGGEWIERILGVPQLWTLQGIVDSSEQVRNAWATKGIAAFADLQEMSALTMPNAVVIAVPPTRSAAVQRECLSFGLPMLVEKPFASSLSELAELQRGLTSKPVPLIPGVQRRTHPAYVALRSAICKSRVHDLSMRLFLGRPADDRPAGHRSDRALCRGGALLDVGYHAIDLVHFLLGNPLEMISCSLGEAGDLAAGIESSAHVLGRCGATWVRLQVDRHGGAKTEQILVATDEGVWAADREGVRHPDGTAFYKCAGSWESAEEGKLAELAVASRRSKVKPEDLWEHLAAFELIEKAYALAHIHGLEGYHP